MRRHVHDFTQAVILALVLVSLVVLPVAPVQAQTPQRAGEVTARLPQGQIERPGAKVAADRGTGVLWQDLVTTDSSGRVRITLDDKSILNIGSGSSLRVVQSDEQTRQTDLTLTFGKMRSKVQNLDTSKGQRFEIRTNTAVLGVIGTDFFVEATATMTRVIVYEGIVLVRNIKPSVRGEQRAGAGSIVAVFVDQPPVAPTRAEGPDLKGSLEATTVGEELPVPEEIARRIEAEPAKHQGFWDRVTKNKKNRWIFIGAVAAIAILSISIPLATGGTDASGCDLPPPSCPVSGP